MQVISKSGLVLWLDPHCNLIAAELPDLFSRPTTGPVQPWPLAWNYSGAAASWDYYVPCTQLVLDEGDVVYFSNRYNHTVYGVDVSDAAVPRHVTWSPLQLPMDPSYQPLTHHSLFVADGLLWLPLRYVFGSLVIHTGTGGYARALVPSKAETPSLLAGNCGIPQFKPGNEDGGGVAYNVYRSDPQGGDPPLLALNTSRLVPWNASKTAFSAYDRGNPNMVPVFKQQQSRMQAQDADLRQQAYDYCIIVVSQAVIASGASGTPATMYAIDAVTGNACMQWPDAGIPLPDPFSSEPNIVSSGAALYNMSARSGSGAVPRLVMDTVEVESDVAAGAVPGSQAAPLATWIYYVMGNSIVQVSESVGLRLPEQEVIAPSISYSPPVNAEQLIRE